MCVAPPWDQAGATVDAEIKECMERAREADAWAGMVPDATLRAQWIEMAAGYRTMARARLEALLNPTASVPPPARYQADRVLRKW
jgi:hypothetical protein